ncbi:MAG: ABC transporter substrate-binding protein, partial [Nitrososphaerales archaeon]
NYNSYFNLNPIPGTGPYTVTQVSENNYISFTQNPNYWGRSLTPAQLAFQPLWDPGHAKTVIVYNKPDDLARYTDLSTGAAQLATIQTSDWNLVKSNSQYSYFVNPPWNGEVALMGLNVNEYPTNITQVRQAIVHAINYTDLYAKGYQENMTPYVGPEYPAWSQFYDLGKYAPYQYNLTLAKQDLAQANITNMPQFTFRTVSGCEVCASAAQIIQSDLSQIGITVNIIVLTPGQYYSGTYGPYATNVANAQAIGQISFVNGGFGWGPATLTPADYWVTFVSNASVWGNWAGYSNPTVQKCVNAFTATTNVSLIQDLCTAAQAQIYKDAPYAWLGTFGLWGVAGGSIVWKNSVVKSFFVDPVWTGQTDQVYFNTVTFVS